MFAKLPNELLHQILAQCSSARDLHSLVAASPCCYRVFALSPESVLLPLLRRLVPTAVWGDFAAVCQAEAFTCAGDADSERNLLQRQDMPAFLDRYFDGGVEFPTTKVHLVAGLRLYATTTYFVNDHVQKAAEEVSFLAEHGVYAAAGAASCPARAARTESSDSGGRSRLEHATRSSNNTDAAMFETPSPTETARLYRAFFRLELQSRVFRHGQRSFAMHSGREQFGLFLRRMPPWAVEELTCAHQYFLYRVWDALEESVNCGGGATTPDEYPPLQHFGIALPFVPSCLQSSAWPLLLSGLVLRGVDFLYDALVAQKSDRRPGRRRKDGALPASSGELEPGQVVPPFLVSALEVARCHRAEAEAAIPVLEDVEGRDGDEEEEVAGPSWGFCEHVSRASAVAGGYLPVLRCEEHAALRATGYVFWDKAKMGSDVMRNAVAGAIGMERWAYHDRYGREHRGLMVK